MATYTITSNTNIDSLTLKTGGDTYNVNGADFTIDQHSRYGQNQDTSSILGNITGSSTLGGNIYFDGRAVRLIPYNTGLGVVPAYNTTISQGSASGLLIGVYDDLATAPVTPGAAMPADGFILIKQWNSVAYAAGVLTGITAVATGADRVGWLDIVGQESTICTINGLNNQTTKVVRGDFYEIGTAPGTPARTDTYQIPSNGAAVYHPGVFVEETAGAGDYVFWPTTTSSALADDVGANAYQGKWCWISTTGVLRFGHDGTNLTGGTLPPAGAKIVIGNVFWNSATSAAKTVTVAPNTTTTTRYRLVAGGLASLELEYSSYNGYLSNNVAKRMNAYRCGFSGTMIMSAIGEAMDWEDCGMGMPVSITATYAFDFQTCLFGGTFTNVVFGRGFFPATNNNVIRLSSTDGIVFDNCKFIYTGVRPGTNNYAVIATNASSHEFKNCLFGSFISWSTGSDLWFHDNEYFFDGGSQPGVSANLNYCWIMNTITDALIEDETFPLMTSGHVPGTGWGSAVSSCANVTFRNLGSYSTPYDSSGYAENSVGWTRVTTTGTVTTTSPHNLRVGDLVVVTITDAVNTITRGVKTILAVPTTTTFTFTATNSGATSGTLSFYSGYTTQGFNIGTATDTKLQNIWFRGHTGQPLVLTAASTRTTFENYMSDDRYSAHPAILGTETKLKSVGFNSISGAAATAVLGSLLEASFTGIDSLADASTVNWARSSNLVTVTQTAHGFRTDDIIQIFDSTNPTGVPNGQQQITVTGVDTFTYTGTNTGTTSGTLSYRVSDSRLHIFMNEPNANTSSYVTVDAGTPKYTGVGTLAALTAGDQVTFETPDWIYAWDNFVNILPDIAASTNIAQHMHLFYAIDRGAGYSAFRNLRYQRAGGGGTISTTTVTMTDTTGVNVDDYVYGTGIADGAKVVSVDNATDITVSIANTATVSGVLQFMYTPNEAQFPTTGVKLKIRFLNFGTPTAALNHIKVFFNSTATTRQNLYPQDSETQTATIQNGVVGSRIQLYDLTANEELYNDVPASFPFTWTDPDPYTADREIRLRASYVDGDEAMEFIDTIIGTSTLIDPDITYRLNQIDDAVYNANAIDGSTVTDVEIVDSVLLAEIDTGEMAWAELYAYEVYWLSTEDGIREEGQLITAVDQANYLFDDLIVTNITFPEVPLIMTGGYARNLTSGQTIDVFDTTGGRMFNAPDHVVAFSTATSVIDGTVDDVKEAILGDTDTWPTGSKGKKIDDTDKNAKLIFRNM